MNPFLPGKATNDFSVKTMTAEKEKSLAAEAI
jgi:hypothetical protein